MESTQHVRSDFFKDCSICHGDLDGQSPSEGQVCISKRCFHIFHEVCIKQWLTEEKDTCPNCNLENFAVYELLPNPEYSEEYNKWKANPETYALENPETLKPPELRGKPQRRELTFEEIQQYFKDRNIEVQNLTEHSTQAQIAKAARESYKAHGMMLDHLEIQSAKQNVALNDIAKGQAEIREEQAEIREKLDHGDLINTYTKKLGGLREKLESKEQELINLPKADYTLANVFGDASKVLLTFSSRFHDAGLASPIYPDKPSIEESRELLKQVDDELNEYLESLSEDVQEVLNRPLPEPEVIEQPVINQPVQNIQPVQAPNHRTNKWLSRKTTLKVAVVAAGVLLIYCLWRSGQSKKLLKTIKIQKPEL